MESVVQFEQKRDWQQFHSPKNLSMGLSIEAGELMEHFLWLTTEESREVIRDQEQMDAVREEIADVLNYLLMLAHTMNIDLSEAFFEKLKRNEEKYPADDYRGKFRLE
ncbi:MAG: nucleotide pyrophosphohydrolase [Sedimentisphaerales bacterium]|nr:nucleotide pyrophosphohydrolase [Sedimentisphaerales bacterium]